MTRRILERRFFIAWLPEPDERLLLAIARATGVAEARLLPTWYGCDKQTGDLPDPEPEEGPVNVEFDSCGAGTMQLQVFGPAVSMPTAALGRAIALADGRKLLFSDCHLFPFTYMMAREDGAIVHVVVRSDHDIVDDFELLPEDPADPDYWRRDVLFAPGDALPPPLVARADPPEHCAVFRGPCPKRQQRCVPIRRG
jgi:hypothetical protein